MIPLYILTHNRRDRQTTFNSLPPKWKEQVTFVVQQNAPVPLCADNSRVLVLPDGITNLHQTRQYLLDNVHYAHAVELDDDVVFSKRRTDEPTKFGIMTYRDFDEMFEGIDDSLRSFPLAGVVAREGANRNTDKYLYATRQMRVHGVNSSWIRDEGWRWDLLRSPGPEDFCMLLQSLTAGFSNVVLNDYCQNQGGSNTDGGCSTYRTPEVHADACHHLAELFPRFVTVVDKTTKGAWGGGTRKDVRIQWKKALQHGHNELRRKNIPEGVAGAEGGDYE